MLARCRLALVSLACAHLAALLPSPGLAQVGSCPAPPAQPPCTDSGGPASQPDSGGVDVAVGNPVHALTGAKAQTDVDAAPEPGVLGLEIRRHYSSAHAGVDGPFGAGWTLSYDTRLFRVGKTAQIIQADGRRVLFQIAGRPEAPTCVGQRPDDGELDVLVAGPGGGEGRKAGKAASGAGVAVTVKGYRWRWPDGREVHFDADGLLVGIEQVSGAERGAESGAESGAERGAERGGGSERGRGAGSERGGGGAEGDRPRLVVVVRRNAAGLIEEVTDPQGRSMRLHHDDAGRIARIDHPRGSWHYQLGGSGALLSVRAPNGVVRRYDYGDGGHPFRLTAIRMSIEPATPDRLVASWTYRADGRVAEARVLSPAHAPAPAQAPAQGATRYRFDYDGDGEAATLVTTADGAWARYRHQTIAGLIRPVSIESASCEACPSALRRLDYDAAGRVIRTQWRPAAAPGAQPDAGGRQGELTDIGFERDSQGRVTRIVAAGSDASGQPRWLRRFAYPEGGGRRPILIARPSVEAGREHQLRLTWGETAATRDRLVRAEEHGYRKGQAIARTVHYRHDAAGQLTAIDGPLPGEADLYRVIRDPAQPARVVGLLDPLGRRLSARQAAALPGLAGWAGLPGLAGLGGALGPLGPLDPDPAGFQVKTGEIVYRAPNGATTRLLIDDFGRTVTVDSDDAGVEQIVHDEADRVVLNSDATGATVTLSHDVAGRPLEREVRPPGRPPEVTRYHYDDREGSVRIEHPVASESLRRDAAGRLVERTVTLHVGPAAGQVLVRRYHYDGDALRPAAIELADGSRLSFGREGGETVRWQHRPDSAVLPLWQRHSQGPTTRWLLGNGVTRTLTRQPDGRVAAIEEKRGEAVVASRNLTYDGRGRITAIADPQGSWLYAYDSRGRLIIAQPAAMRPGAAGAGAASPSPPIRTPATAKVMPTGIQQPVDSPPAAATGQIAWWFAHDPNGNRLFAKAPDQAVDEAGVAPIDPAEALPTDRPLRLAYGEASDRVQGPTYDAAGRPLRWRGLDLGWHAGGRIETVARDGQVVARYHYNHRGERVAKQVGQAWTYFDYDDGRLALEIRHGEAAVRHFIHDGDLPAVMIDAPAREDGVVARMTAVVQSLLGRVDPVRWLHLDHRGAPVATTDGRGEVVWTARLSPDGARLPGSTGAEREDPRLRLPGQYHDAETGLHDNRQRSYDPALGRFLSPDPLGLRAGSNPYLYAGGDPINQVDPSGLLLFAFDGTGNLAIHRTNVWLMSEVYDEQATHSMRPGERPVHYEQGIGTTGSSTERGYQGVTADDWREAVDRQYQRFLTAAAALDPGDALFIDVVGFSRGAIQARVFGEMVARALREGRVPNGDQVLLRFMGLYDAVDTNIFDGMSGDEIYCATRIAPEWQHVTHLVALNEHRSLFPVTLMGRQPSTIGVRRELGMVGGHANIGGGYDPGDSPNSRARSDLSEVALWVMLEEARQAGVRFRPLPREHLEVSHPVINDETAGSDGDPYRMVKIDGERLPLWQTDVGGVSREEGRKVGAPGLRLPSGRDPARVPPGSGPSVVGRIDIAAYCDILISRGILPACPQLASGP